VPSGSALPGPDPVVLPPPKEENVRTVVPQTSADYLGVPTEYQSMWKKDSKNLSALQQEVLRILELPFIKNEYLICPNPDEFGRQWIKPGADFSLRQIQTDGCFTFAQMGGLVGPIGVGYGKTIISILCAAIALKVRGHYHACIMVPPQVLDQLLHTDLPAAKEYLLIDDLAFIPVTGSQKKRKKAAEWPGRCVFIYSYSLLSSETGYEELIAMSPTCFILDEAHNLARSTTTRTKRWYGALKEIEARMVSHPDITAERIETVALSGTITKKSIKDYSHISRQALGQSSPVPIRETAINLFAGVIDAGSNAAQLSDQEKQAFQQFLEWNHRNGHDPASHLREINSNNINPTLQEVIRESFRFRMNSVPGLVATAGQGVDASLLIHWVEPKKQKDDPNIESMVRLMKKVAIDGQTPDGDTIDYSMHNYKWLWELTGGFYNSLVWPTTEEEQIRYQNTFGKSISTAEAEMLIAGGQQHHALLQEYHKQLRHFLDGQHIPGCDTPMLVAREITRQLDREEPKHSMPMHLINAYHEQKEARFEDMPSRLSVPVRVTDYKIRNVVDWAEDNKKHGGIIWYHHPNLGQWVTEYLEQAGIEHTFAPAGENKKVFNKGLVVASFAHGTGKNLQHQCNNYFLEIRREAHIMEQALGRTHRSGQLSDEVHAYMLLGNGFDIALFNGCLKDADYAQTSLGSRQRLCYATYNPVIPPTNPRLMQKLGITNKFINMPTLASYESITPESIKELADAFYPAIYGNEPTPTHL
jgi:hypothetical protein